MKLRNSGDSINSEHDQLIINHLFLPGTNDIHLGI